MHVHRQPVADDVARVRQAGPRIDGEVHRLGVQHVAVAPEVRDVAGGKDRADVLVRDLARAQGDLSENAEYDAAKDEQRDIEARIEEIENILKHAEVVDEDEADTEMVSIGCRVKIHDIDYDEDLEFQIVGSMEANSLGGKISNESPVGKALMGAKVGNVVEVEMGDATDHYQILSIERV